MPARPMSVTVVAWLLIVFGLFALLGVVSVALLWNTAPMQQALARVHVPLSVQVAVGLAGLVIRLSCGVGLLFRQNWARFLYVAWSVVAMSYAVITTPYTLWLVVPSLIFTLVIVYFLFTPVARRYFTGATLDDGTA